jgi:hypothetical protein
LRKAATGRRAKDDSIEHRRALPERREASREGLLDLGSGVGVDLAADRDLDDDGLFPAHGAFLSTDSGQKG